eukprot:gb/GECG01008857.1/.p1 GENE.gb/GECG01008857.1/~~gb/GECG01008857.1/.p1  ORF type:complete len:2828 (+),score=288.10 gb/GECG01008857.1/:1-8484(+)
MNQSDVEPVTIGHETLYGHYHTPQQGRHSYEVGTDDDSAAFQGEEKTWSSAFGDAVERAFFFCKRATQVWKNVSLLKHVLGASYPEARLLTFEGSTEGASDQPEQGDTLVAVVTQKSINWRRQSENYLVSWPVTIPPDLEFVPTSASKDASGLFVFVSTTGGAIYTVRRGSGQAVCVVGSQEVPWNAPYYQDQPILVHAKPESASFTHAGIPVSMSLTTLTASGRIWRHSLDLDASETKMHKHFVVSVGFTLVTAADVGSYRVSGSIGYVLVVGGLVLDRPGHDSTQLCRFFWIPGSASDDTEPTLMSEFDMSSVSSAPWSPKTNDDAPLATLVENAKSSKASSLFRRKKTQNRYFFGLVRFFTRPHEFTLLPAYIGSSVPSAIRLQTEGFLTALSTTTGDFSFVDFNNLRSPFSVRRSSTRPISAPVFEWIDDSTGIVIGSGKGSIAFRIAERQLSCNILCSEDIYDCGLDNDALTLAITPTVASLTENSPLYQILALQGSTQWQYLSSGLDLRYSKMGIRRPTLRIDTQVVSELSDPFKLGKVMPAYARELNSFVVRVHDMDVQVWPTVKSMQESLAAQNNNGVVWVVDLTWKLCSYGFLDLGSINSACRAHSISAALGLGKALNRLSETTLFSSYIRYLEEVYQIYGWHGCVLDVAVASLLAHMLDTPSYSNNMQETPPQPDLEALYRMRYYRMSKNLGVPLRNTFEFPACQRSSEEPRRISMCSFATDPLLRSQQSMRVTESPKCTTLQEYVGRTSCSAWGSFGAAPRCLALWVLNCGSLRKHTPSTCNQGYLFGVQESVSGIVLYYASLLNELDLTLERTLPEEGSPLDALVYTLTDLLPEDHFFFADEFRTVSGVVANWYQDEMGMSLRRQRDAPLLTYGGDAGSSLTLLPFKELVYFDPDNVMHLFADKWSPASVRRFIKRSLNEGNVAGAESALQAALGERNENQIRFELLNELISDNSLLSYNSSVWNRERAVREVVQTILCADGLSSSSIEEAHRLVNTLGDLTDDRVIELLENTIFLAERWTEVCDARQEIPLDDTSKELSASSYRMQHFAVCILMQSCNLSCSKRTIDVTQCSGSSEIILENLANMSYVDTDICSFSSDSVVSHLLGKLEVHCLLKEMCDGLRYYLICIMNSLMATKEENGDDDYDTSFVLQLPLTFTRFVLAAPIFPTTALVGDICDMLLEYSCPATLLDYCQQLFSSAYTVKDDSMVSGVLHGISCWLRRRVRQIPYVDFKELPEHLLYISETVVDIVTPLEGGEGRAMRDKPRKLQQLAYLSPLYEAVSTAVANNVLKDAQELVSLFDKAIDMVQQPSIGAHTICCLMLDLECVEWEELFHCVFEKQWPWQRDDMVETFRDHNEYRLITQQFKSLGVLAGGDEASPALYAVLDDNENNKRVPTWSSSSLGPLFNPLSIFSFQTSSPGASKEHVSDEDAFANDSILRSQCYRSLLEARGIASEDTDMVVPFYPGSQDMSMLVDSIDEGIICKFPRRSQVAILIELGKQLVIRQHTSEMLTCLRALRQLLLFSEEEVLEDAVTEKLLELFTLVTGLLGASGDLATDLFCEVTSLINTCSGLCSPQYLQIMKRLYENVAELLLTYSDKGIHPGKETNRVNEFMNHPFLSHSLSPIIGEEYFRARVESQIRLNFWLNQSMSNPKAWKNDRPNEKLSKNVQPLAAYDTNAAVGVMALMDDRSLNELLCSWLNELREEFTNDVIYEAVSPSENVEQFQVSKSQYIESCRVWRYMSAQGLVECSVGDSLVGEHILNEELVYVAFEHPTIRSRHSEESYQIEEVAPLVRVLSVPITSSSTLLGEEINDMVWLPWKNLILAVLLNDSLDGNYSNPAEPFISEVAEMLLEGPSLIMRLYGIFVFSSWAVQVKTLEQLHLAYQCLKSREEKLSCSCGMMVGVAASSLAEEDFSDAMGHAILDCCREYPNLAFNLICKMWEVCDGTNHQILQQLLSFCESINVELPLLSILRVKIRFGENTRPLSLKDVVAKVAKLGIEVDVKRAIGLPTLMWEDIPVEDFDELLKGAYATGVKILNGLALSKKVGAAVICEALGEVLSNLVRMKATDLGLSLESAELTRSLPSAILSRPNKFSFSEMLSLGFITQSSKPTEYIQLQMKRKTLQKNSAIRLLSFVGTGSYKFWIKRFKDSLVEETRLDGSSCVQETPDWYSQIIITEEDKSRIRKSVQLLKRLVCLLSTYIGEESLVSRECQYVLTIEEKFQRHSVNIDSLRQWDKCFLLTAERENESVSLKSCLEESFGAILVYQALRENLQNTILELKAALGEATQEEIEQSSGGSIHVELVGMNDENVSSIFLAGITFLLRKALETLALQLLEADASQLAQRLSSIMCSREQEYSFEGILKLDLDNALFVLMKCCGDSKEPFIHQCAHVNVHPSDIKAELHRLIESEDEHVRKDLQYLVSEMTQDSEKILLERLLPDDSSAILPSACNNFEDATIHLNEAIKDTYWDNPQFKPRVEALLTLIMRRACRTFSEMESSAFTGSVSRDAILSLSRLPPEAVSSQLEYLILESRIHTVSSSSTVGIRINGIVFSAPPVEQALKEQCYSAVVTILQNSILRQELREADLTWLKAVCKGIPSLILSEREYYHIMLLAAKIEIDQARRQALQEICAVGSVGAILSEAKHAGESPVLASSTALTLVKYWPVSVWSNSSACSSVIRALRSLYFHLEEVESKGWRLLVLCLAESMLNQELESALRVSSGILGGSQSLSVDCRLLHSFLMRSLHVLKGNPRLCEVICAADRQLDEQMCAQVKSCHEALCNFLGTAPASTFDESSGSATESGFIPFHSWFSSF